MKTPNTLKGFEPNFNTLIRAVKSGEICLVACTDSKTGETVPTICAMSHLPNGDYDLVPLAKMFTGNPYEELCPPDTNEKPKNKQGESYEKK